MVKSVTCRSKGGDEGGRRGAGGEVLAGGVEGLGDALHVFRFDVDEMGEDLTREEGVLKSAVVDRERFREASRYDHERLVGVNVP